MNLHDIAAAPWAITPEAYGVVQDVFARHLRGETADIAAIEARLGVPLHNEPKTIVVDSGVAVISIEGVLAKRANLLTQISGGTSMQIATDQVLAARDDPAVRAIVLQIDSPGGTVDGTEGLADAVRSVRGVKPIVAVADGMMASAACWIGTAADSVHIASSTTLTGSIGVVAKHTNISQAEQKAGIETTEITAGKYKRIASEHAPLTAEGRAHMQGIVDAYYSVFVNAVAQNRRTTPDQVLKHMADGRTFVGAQAITAGLVDSIATVDSMILKLSMSGGGMTTKPRVVAVAAAPADVASGPQLQPYGATGFLTAGPPATVPRSRTPPPDDILRRGDDAGAMAMLEASADGKGVDWSIVGKRPVTAADLSGEMPWAEFELMNRGGGR